MSKNITIHWANNFYRLFFGQGLASIMTTTVNYVLVFYLTAVSKSASLLTVAQIISLVPMAALSPLAGILVDRLSKKKLLVMSDGLVGAITVMLFLKEVDAGGQLSISVILFSNFLRSVAMSVQNPAVQSSVPELVPSDGLLKVNGYYSALQAVNQLIPPVLARILYGSFHINDILLISVLANVIGLVAVGITSFPTHEKTNHARASVVQDFKIGFHAVRRHKSLLHLLTYKVISVSIIMPSTVLYPLMTSNHFHGSLKVDAPIVEVGLGVGMLMSGLFLGRFASLLTHPLTSSLIGAVLVGSVLTVSGLLPGNHAGFIIFVVINFVGGLALPMIDAPIQTFLQESVEREHIGKVISLFLMAIGLAGPFGLMVGGFWSKFVPTAGMFITSGLLLLLLVGLAWHDPSIRSINKKN